MKTTSREGPDVSAIGGRRLENRNTDFFGFRDIDQREGTAVDQEITPHQSESALTAQRVNRRSTAGGDAASGSGVLRKPSSEEALEKCVASAGRESSAEAAEGALIDRILSGHKELFMDLICPHQRTVYATVFTLLANQ
jgi:hypothetical protein